MQAHSSTSTSTRLPLELQSPRRLQCLTDGIDKTDRTRAAMPCTPPPSAAWAALTVELSKGVRRLPALRARLMHPDVLRAAIALNVALPKHWSPEEEGEEGVPGIVCVDDAISSRRRRRNR